MKAAAFDYVVANTVSEVLTSLTTDGAKVLAGGQSLVPLMAFRLARPTFIVDLNRTAELETLHADDDGTLHIGAMTRQATIARWPSLPQIQPVVAEILPYVGHGAIRNRGTVGGSLAHADPASEWPAVVVVLDAEMDIASARGERRIAAAQFFQGPFMTDLDEDELLTSVHLPPFPNAGWGAYEVARRSGDFALAGAVAVVAASEGVITHARIALFGVETVTRRIAPLEEALLGASPSDLAPLVDEHISKSVFAMDDIHAGRELRTQLAATVTLRALEQACARSRSDATR